MALESAVRTSWYSYTKRAVVRRLSENSRASVTELAKELKCSRNTVISNIESLEKEFDIYYTLEFHTDVTGRLEKLQLIRMKFASKPSIKEIESIFGEIDTRLLATTEGDFDLLASVAVYEMKDYLKLTYNTLLKFSPHAPQIDIYDIIKEETGFTLAPNSVVGKRDFSRFGLDSLDRRIIMLLNENSRMQYAEIARRLRMDRRTVRYRLSKIIKSGIIRRFTIILKKLPTDHNVAMFLTPKSASTGILSRKLMANRHYISIDKELPLINNFQYIADLSGNCNSFYMACFENEYKMMKRGVKVHYEIYKEDKPILYRAKITKIIKGHLPIRSIDLGKQLQTEFE